MKQKRLSLRQKAKFIALSEKHLRQKYNMKTKIKPGQVYIYDTNTSIFQIRKIKRHNRQKHIIAYNLEDHTIMNMSEIFIQTCCYYMRDLETYQQLKSDNVIDINRDIEATLERHFTKILK